MKKRAVSHIEMVISFGIFALFTFWLIVFLNPVRNQNISTVLMDTIQKSIIANATLEVLEVPATVQPTPICFTINNPFDTLSRDNIVVTDANGAPLQFDLVDSQSANISIGTNGNFYRISYAITQFTSSSLGGASCPYLAPSQFAYTSTRTYTPLFIPRLERIKDLYDQDYEQLKEELNLPRIADFSINITNLETHQNLFEMSKTKPKKVEVIAREVPIEVMLRDGSIIKSIMNIQVW